MICTPSPTSVLGKRTEFSPNPNTNNSDSVDLDEQMMQAVLLASMEDSSGTADGSDEQLQKARAAAEAQQALFESMVAPPLVARPMALAAWAKEEAHVIGAKAVAALSESELGAVQLCRIRGDGHCLFRAIGASLVLGAVWGGRDRVNSLREHLAACAAAEPAARGEAAALEAVLGAAGSASPLQDPFAVLSADPEDARSAALVGSLRAAAVTFMQSRAERFRHVVEAPTANVDGFGAYCAGMASMDTDAPKYGGHPEMVALSEALRLHIVIHDTAALGAGAAAAPSTPHYSLGDESHPRVHLLRRGLHYNLCLTASAEGEQLADCGEIGELAQ